MGGERLRVALVSIANCPSLALRNIAAYCASFEDVREAVRFELHDYDLRDFEQSRDRSSQQWSFITRFDEAIEEILAGEPDLVAFSCYLWSTELSVHLAQLVRRMRPEVEIVLGGPDAGPRAAELLARHPELDAVVEGDGEIPMLGLLRRRLAGGGGDPDGIPGLRFRRGSEVVENPPAPKVDMARLRNVWGEEPPTQEELAAWPWPHLLVETLRGCPYLCSFCMYGKSEMNAKETGASIGELLALLERGLLVEIIDPTFTTYRRRAKEILRALAAHDYPGQLTIEAYPDSLDEEMADLCAAARVCCIGVGFQTASAEGSEAVRRPRHLDRFERAVRLLQERRLPFYVDIIYGLPRTTVDDFLDTVDYLHSLGVTRLMIYRLLGLPGSPMMADATEHGLVFSRTPPYELLRSDGYSHREILFCERFRQAYDHLPAALGIRRFEELVREAGSLSAVVRSHLDAGGGAPAGGGEEPAAAPVPEGAARPASPPSSSSLPSR